MGKKTVDLSKPIAEQNEAFRQFAFAKKPASGEKKDKKSKK